MRSAAALARKHVLPSMMITAYSRWILVPRPCLRIQQCDIDFQAIDLVVLTHLHGDHFGGLPYRILAHEYASKEKRPLHILGPMGTKTRLNQLL